MVEVYGVCRESAEGRNLLGLLVGMSFKRPAICCSYVLNAD